MPTVISRGAAAARAFGFTGSSSGQIYTQVFASNGTFTPLPGVTNVTTLYGRGGSSTSDTTASFPGDYAYSIVSPASGGSGGTPLPLAYTTIAQNITDIVNTCNAGGIQTIYHDYFGGGVEIWDINPDNTYTLNPSTKFPFTAFMVAGTWAIFTNTLPNPPSGSVTSYATSPDGYYHATGNYIAGGSAGTNSSALSYTFSGASQVGTYPTATGQAATPVTYNNVAVTPGTGYPIVVGAGGEVRISFIIP